jgi:hypothetical protein
LNVRNCVTRAIDVLALHGVERVVEGRVVVRAQTPGFC